MKFKEIYNHIKQFAKFCFVGTFGALMNYGIFYLFYDVFSVYYVVSSLTGFFVSAVAVFVFNRSWTFQVRHGRISKQFVMFILLMSLSFVSGGVSIYLFTDKVGIRPEFSQLISMSITTAINFLGSKFWVFNI